MSGDTHPKLVSLTREGSWSIVASNAATSASPSMSRSHSSNSSSQPPTPFVHLSRDNSVSSSSFSDVSPLQKPSRETSQEIVQLMPSPASSSSPSAPQGPRVTSWAAAVKRTLPVRQLQSNEKTNFRVIDDHYTAAASSSASSAKAEDTTDLLPCGCPRSLAGVELRGLQLRHTCELDDPTNQQAAGAGLYKYHPSHAVPGFARIPSTDDTNTSDFDDDDDPDGTQHALDLLDGSTRERVSLAASSSSSSSSSSAHKKSRKQLRLESVEWLRSLREGVSAHRKHFESILESHRHALQQQAEWIQTTSSQKRNNRFSASKHTANGSQSTASTSSSSSARASEATTTSPDHRGMIMSYASPCHWSDFQSDFLQHYLPLILCQFDNVKLGTELMSLSRIEPEKPSGQPYYGLFNMAHFNHAHGFVDREKKLPHTTLQVKPTVYLELGCARTLRGAVLRNRYGDGLHKASPQQHQPSGKEGHTAAVCAEICLGACNAVLGAGPGEEGTEFSEVYKLFAHLPAHSEEVHTAYVCAQVPVDQQEKHRSQYDQWHWIHSERTPYSRFSKPRTQPSYKWTGEFSQGTAKGLTTMLEVKFKLRDPKKYHQPLSQ